MPRMYVCGDSFLAPTQDHEWKYDLKGSSNKHFSEIVAKQLNYDLVALSRGAASNSCIRLQIDTAIKEQADFVLVGMTAPSRIEWPLKPRSFETDQGVYNIDYSYHPDLSSTNPKFSLKGYVSDTIVNALEGYVPVATDEVLQALKLYVSYIYDEGFRQQQDAWIIASGINALETAKIPYLLLLLESFKTDKFFTQNNKRFLSDSTPNFSKAIPYYYSSYDEDLGSDTPRRWHVSDKNQVVIADHICKYINMNNLLSWS